MKLKYKAFTLLELLIGLIISSIVIAIGYTSYHIIHKQYSNYKKYRKELIELAVFNSEIETNFYNSELIYFDGESLIFKFKNKKDIIFQFSEKYILRKDRELIDTFFVQNKNVFFGYVDEKSKTINALFFNSSLLNENFDLKFEKKYSSDILLKNDLNE